MVHWFPSLQLWERHIWMKVNLSGKGLAVMFHVFTLLVDLHSWSGGVPSLHQPPFEGEAAETSRAAGTTGRQPQGHRPPPHQLQTEHHSSGQILPGEGPYCYGKTGWLVCVSKTVIAYVLHVSYFPKGAHYLCKLHSYWTIMQCLIYIQWQPSVPTKKDVCLSHNETGSKGVKVAVTEGRFQLSCQGPKLTSWHRWIVMMWSWEMESSNGIFYFTIIN